MLRRLAILLLAVPAIAADNDGDKVYRVGNGVSLPKVLHKVDPSYSKEAEVDRIQGTSLYSLVVDKTGKPRDIELISPIGYGLDDRGLNAIRQWIFKPAEKDGMPVSVKATIYVNFRFPGLPFDSKAEERRTSFNAAIHDLESPARETTAITTLQKLAVQKYPPAMALVGDWMVDGRRLPKDLAGGMELIRKAADKYEKSALFALGLLYTRGEGVSPDPAKGVQLIKEASTYGSQSAQEYLGDKYEKGDAKSPSDLGRARSYFRLCAARGNSLCQFRLGRLLTPSPASKGDPVQAVAWLELAIEGHAKEAEAPLRSLRETLSAEDIDTAEKLKPQLTRH